MSMFSVLDGNQQLIYGQDCDSADQRETQSNGTLTVVDPQPPSTPSPDLLGDLLSPLAIEGPQPAENQSDHSLGADVKGAAIVEEALALAPIEEQMNTVQVLLSLMIVNMIYPLAFIFITPKIK